MNQFGLSEDILVQLRNVLRSNSKVEKALIFGSRAKGNYRDGSDIDIALVGESLSLSDQLRLEQQLDDLLLPYKIDLLIFHKIENMDLVDHINRVGITFYQCL